MTRRDLSSDEIADMTITGPPAGTALDVAAVMAQGLDEAQVHEHEAADQPESFKGLSHEEALRLEVPPTRELVEDVIEAGTVGTLTALPETFKSWVGQEITHKLAGDGDRVLGRFALPAAPAAVGYWWQDDSVENELRRIQAYANGHGFTGQLPIRWHLNEGLRLPDGVAALRAEVERERQVLVVLDSLYNFLPGTSLKDEDVAAVLAALKVEVCDPTGATVCVVDHAPWPTEGNKGQRRSYGSVFKAAAIRWGIYLANEDGTIYVEARGNNIAGLKRTAAVWNEDTLELRLVEAPSQTLDLDGRIAKFLGRNPGAATSVVVAAVEGDDKAIRQRLKDSDAFANVPAALFGKPKNTKCWARAEDVPSLLDATSVENPTDLAPTLARETNDNVGGDSTPRSGGSRTDDGCRPRWDPAPTSTDDDAGEGRQEGAQP